MSQPTTSNYSDTLATEDGILGIKAGIRILYTWRHNCNLFQKSYGYFVNKHLMSAERNYSVLSVISGFRRDVDEIFALLGCYAASNANALPTFRYSVSVPSSRVKKSNEASWDFLTLEDGTDTLSRNVGKGLSLGAA
jgi:hypothetical protein